jgi:hypothetical protein
MDNMPNIPNMPGMPSLTLTSVYTGNSCTGEAILIPVMPANPELAQAYIPYQIYGKTFLPDEALEKGTVFPALVK